MLRSGLKRSFVDGVADTSCKGSNRLSLGHYSEAHIVRETHPFTKLRIETLKHLGCLETSVAPLAGGVCHVVDGGPLQVAVKHCIACKGFTTPIGNAYNIKVVKVG